MSLIERIDRALERPSGQAPFLVLAGETTTRAAFSLRVRKLMAVLAKAGLSAGDRIGVCSDNARDVAALLFAAFRSGIAIANLNPDLTAAERRHAVSACRLDHLFIDADKLRAAPLPESLRTTAITPARARPAGGLLGRLLRTTPQPAETGGLEAELAAVEPVLNPPEITPDSIALMLFTSGTTSAPKVVQLSHGNLEAQLAAFDQVYDYDETCRILNVLPLHFTDGIMHGPVYAFLTGAALFRPGKFEVQEIEALLHSIYRDRITHFIAVPAMLSIIDRLHDSFNDAFDTPDFRYIRSSGDRLPEPLWASIEDRFNVRVVNTYGLSETVCEAIYCGPSDALYRRGTIGKPVGCEIRIDDNGTGEGELLIRGDLIMQGYLDQPELTAAAIRDGWFHTGDLARMDAEGFVSIIGRQKTLIISGGVNIQPQEITDVVSGHEAVAEAVTFGLPDPVWGEQVVCVIELAPGFATLPESALRQHCQAQLAPHKVPRIFKAVDRIPRNPAGKVLLETLRQSFTGAGPSRNRDDTTSLDQRILAVAAGVFGCSAAELRMTSDTRNTFGWDSLAHMNLMFATEEAFSIKLSPRDILSVSRLEHLRDAVARHVGEAV